MLYLAEFYLPAGASLTGVARRARAGAAQAARTGAQVRFIQPVVVPQDESCFASTGPAQQKRSRSREP